MDIEPIFTDLQRKIAAFNDPEFAVWDQTQLMYFRDQNDFLVEFYGAGYDDDPQSNSDDWDPDLNAAYIAVLDTLSRPEISGRLKSLVFRGPDEGANGIRNWDFSRLVYSEAEFSKLARFFVEGTSPDAHNHACISASKNVYDEEGMIAGLVEKMPQLQHLTVPTAPDSTFFQKDLKCLRFLRVEAGLGTQNFIKNLSTSESLPALRAFDFTDFCMQWSDEEVRAESTPFYDYLALIESEAFDQVGHFTLRNAQLSDAQFFDLQELRPMLQFKKISAFPGKYIRNMLLYPEGK